VFGTYKLLKHAFLNGLDENQPPLSDYWAANYTLSDSEPQTVAPPQPQEWELPFHPKRRPHQFNIGNTADNDQENQGEIQMKAMFGQVSDMFTQMSKGMHEQRELRFHSFHEDMKDKHIGIASLVFGIITLIVSITGGCALREMTTVKAARFKT